MEKVRENRSSAESVRSDTKAFYRGRRLAKEDGADEMARYGRMFARWAKENNIPFDYYAHELRLGGRWAIAVRSPHHLHVDRRGKIQSPNADSLGRERTRMYTAQFDPKDVEQRIAELCVEHELEAPDIEP